MLRAWQMRNERNYSAQYPWDKNGTCKRRGIKEPRWLLSGVFGRNIRIIEAEQWKRWRNLESKCGNDCVQITAHRLFAKSLCTTLLAFTSQISCFRYFLGNSLIASFAVAFFKQQKMECSFSVQNISTNIIRWLQ